MRSRWSRISVRGATLVLVLSLLAATVAVAIATRLTYQQHEDARERASRAIDNSGLFQQALSGAYDEWITLTAYFVTRDPGYIERFHVSRVSVDRALAALRDDTQSRDPAWAQRLDAYLARHERFVEAEEEIIEALGNDDLVGALAIAVDTDLTVDSAALLADLRGEIETQQADVRAAQGQQRLAVLNTIRWSLGVAAACVFMLLLLALASHHWIDRALQRTTLATRAIASGDLTARVRPEGPRELAGLADDVNSMAEALIRRSEELRDYLSKNLEARTAELERANAELGREAEEHRRTGEALARTLEAERELEQQLRHQAFHDPLTGLANRARFLDRIEQAIGRSARSGAPIAVLFMDIDDFKSVNDSLGHPAGDELLIEVAARVVAAVRPSDLAARFGGDEFAVLIEDGAGDRVAHEIADRIIEELRKPTRLGQRDVAVRASVGIALASGSDSRDEVLRRADVAMYAAKARGKGRSAAWEPAMETALAGNLERDTEAA